MSNAEIAQCRQNFDVNLVIKVFQNYFVTKMMANLSIRVIKKPFCNLSFFRKMKLVSTVRHINITR